MSAEAMDVRNRLIGRTKERLVDNAAVFGSGLAVIISAFAMLVVGFVWGASHSERQYTALQIEQLASSDDTLRIRTAKLDAWLKAKGIPIEEIYGD